MSEVVVLSKQTCMLQLHRASRYVCGYDIELEGKSAAVAPSQRAYLLQWHLLQQSLMRQWHRAGRHAYCSCTEAADMFRAVTLKL